MPSTSNAASINKTIITELVVIVSNWHQNRDAQQRDAEIRCKLSDIQVSFKFASEQFKKKDGPAQRYNYDQHGLSFSYLTFLSLMSDTRFTKDFLELAKTQFEKKERYDLVPQPIDQGYLDEGELLRKQREIPDPTLLLATSENDDDDGDDDGDDDNAVGKVGRSPKDNDDDDDDEIVLRPGPVSSKKHRKRGTDALKTGESVLKSSRKK